MRNARPARKFLARPACEPKREAYEHLRQLQFGASGAIAHELGQRLERKIRLSVLELGVELERIGLHERPKPERAALGIVPHVPMGAFQSLHHHVRGDHRMRVDGLARKIHADAGADHAARAIATGKIARAQVLHASVGVLQRRSDAVGVLAEARQPGAELDPAAKVRQSRAQDVERAWLQQHPHAWIGNVRRRIALFDAVEFRRAERLRPVPRHRWIILSAGRVDLADDAEIVVDLQRARLDALAARAGAMIRRRGLASTMRTATPRRARSQASTRPAGPAPAIRTSMSATLTLWTMIATSPNGSDAVLCERRKIVTPKSFDHFVGAGEHGGRNDEAQFFGGFQIDDKFDIWSEPVPAGSPGSRP